MRKRLPHVWTFAMATIIVFSAESCSGGTALPSAATTLRDGRSLTSLLAKHDSGMIILVDPAECLSCNATLHSMLTTRKRRPDVVWFVLLRSPTEFERKQIALQLQAPDGVLSASGSRSGTLGPRAMVFVKGHAPRLGSLEEMRPFFRALITPQQAPGTLPIQ
jgi:hypothetical protein